MARSHTSLGHRPTIHGGRPFRGPTARPMCRTAHGCTDVRFGSSQRTSSRLLPCMVSCPFKFLSHRTLPTAVTWHSPWTSTDVRMYASKPASGGGEESSSSSFAGPAPGAHGCTCVRMYGFNPAAGGRRIVLVLVCWACPRCARMYGCTDVRFRLLPADLLRSPPSPSHFKLLSHRTLPDHCQLHSRWTGTDVRMYASKPPAGGENFSLGHAPP